MNETITGLDIGTTKICAAIAAMGSDGRCEVLGTGAADAMGVNKGFVSNLDKLADSIHRAVSSAEEQAAVKAHRVAASISGASVDGKVTEGFVPLSRRGREITKRDIDKALEASRNISLSLEKDFLYAEPQEFIVDENAGIENPLGLFGARLKVRSYVITALASHIQNVSKAVGFAGYEMVEAVPNAVAAGSSILGKKERADGAVIIDIGGGVTELAIFSGGVMCFFDSVNVGGMDLTARLSAHFKVPFAAAEMIKKRCGGISADDMARTGRSVFNIDERSVTVACDAVNGLLKERFDEMMHALKERLAGSRHFAAQIPSVIVTGGCALLSGAVELIESSLGIPAVLGRISNVAGEPSIVTNPASLNAICLAKCALEKRKRPSRRPARGGTFLTDTAARLRELLEEYF